MTLPQQQDLFIEAPKGGQQHEAPAVVPGPVSRRVLSLLGPDNTALLEALQALVDACAGKAISPRARCGGYCRRRFWRGAPA